MHFFIPPFSSFITKSNEIICICLHRDIIIVIMHFLFDFNLIYFIFFWMFKVENNKMINY